MCWSCRCWVKRVSNSNFHPGLEHLPLRCQSAVQSSSTPHEQSPPAWPRMAAGMELQTNAIVEGPAAAERPAPCTGGRGAARWRQRWRRGRFKAPLFLFHIQRNTPKKRKIKGGSKASRLIQFHRFDVLPFQRPEGSKVAAISSSKRGWSLLSAGPEVAEPWVLVLRPEQSCCGPIPPLPSPPLHSPPVLQECSASAGGRVIRSSGRGQ